MVYKRKPKRYITRLLPKVYISTRLSKTIENSLLELGMFTGDYSKCIHITQSFYLLGFKNNYSFYDAPKSLLLFKNALSFLKNAAKKPKTLFIFVGAPSGSDEQTQLYFRILHLKCVFFLPAEWDPGFISKQISTKNVVLILYDINTNSAACHEGLKANIPIVGFATPSCNIQGIDYPVLINLSTNALWYSKLILALFRNS